MKTAKGNGESPAYPCSGDRAYQEGITKLELFTAMNIQAMVSSILDESGYQRFREIAGMNGFETVSDWIASESVKQAKATLNALATEEK